MSAPIAVAMSGGLDSSVTAWLLAQGEDPVLGLSMLLWDRSEESTNGRCCGALDLGDAKRVAQQCGIRHYTLKMDEEFREHVVDPFVHDYLAGRTPIPCTGCNTWLKFDLFLERARKLGADKMATGHYARIVDGDGELELHTPLDLSKDQSYYLFELTQEQLAVSLFPLGEKNKDEVREMARQAGLVVAEKAESMEVCFVANGIQEFVEEQVAEHPERFPEAPDATPATVVDRDGAVVGEGAPYYRYTVGQRRGLGVATGEKRYVLNVLPSENQVVIGGAEDLFSSGLRGERLHWIGRPPAGDLEATVKIRSRHAGVPAKIRPLEDRRVEIEFAEPQRGVTPGQAAVFYDGTRVLGGCWIDTPTSTSTP